MFCQVTAAQEWDFFANKIEFECTVPCFSSTFSGYSYLQMPCEGMTAKIMAVESCPQLYQRLVKDCLVQ